MTTHKQYKLIVILFIYFFIIFFFFASHPPQHKEATKRTTNSRFIFLLIISGLYDLNVIFRTRHTVTVGEVLCYLFASGYLMTVKSVYVLRFRSEVAGRPVTPPTVGCDQQSLCSWHSQPPNQSVQFRGIDFSVGSKRRTISRIRFMDGK